MSFNNPKDRIVALEQCYRDGGGDYLGQSTSPGKGWEEKFEDFLIPESVSRKDLFEQFKKANDSNGNSHYWEKVFVWTMAWGYGPGYGAHRTNKIRNYENNKQGKFEVAKWMKELSEIVNEKSETSVKNAYKWLKADWSKARKGLGPAFATKLLYVLSPESNRAPIIDAVASRWLEGYQIKATSKYFDIDSYLHYVNFAEECLQKINGHLPAGTASYEDRGLIEYLIFQDELFLRGSFKRVAVWRLKCQNALLKTR